MSILLFEKTVIFSMAVGFWSVRWMPIDDSSASGFPLGCRWSWSTMSVFSGHEEARSPGKKWGSMPGVQIDSGPDRSRPGGARPERKLLPSPSASLTTASSWGSEVTTA